MDLRWKMAGSEDLELLVETRIQVLRAANQLEDSVDMSAVEKETRIYYERALKDGSHIACLVFDGETFVGAGGVSFYQVLPTYHSSSGRRAYIMNMYTHPDYRRRGIALATLERLTAAARGRGISQISLEATAMGRKLYENYGFRPMNDEMELPVELMR